MDLKEDALKKKKVILRAYEKTLDAVEDKLSAEEKRIAKLKAGDKSQKPGACFIIFIVLAVLFLVMTFITMISFFNARSGGGTFYVKSSTVNIRKCPALNCDVIDTFPLNSEIATPYKTLDEAPDWVEINYTNDKNQEVTGYVVKTVLSETKVSN
jgi:hypothetical protein